MLAHEKERRPEQTATLLRVPLLPLAGRSGAEWPVNRRSVTSPGPAPLRYPGRIRCRSDAPRLLSGWAGAVAPVCRATADKCTTPAQLAPVETTSTAGARPPEMPKFGLGANASSTNTSEIIKRRPWWRVW